MVNVYLRYDMFGLVEIWLLGLVINIINLGVEEVNLRVMCNIFFFDGKVIDFLI